MEKIKSFQVNHLELLRGLYVSREDKINDFSFTTYDLRFTRPNFEPVMDTSTVHAIEHLGATFFRTQSTFKDRVMYFGPMGCRTGFYLIVGNESIDKVKEEVRRCMDYIIAYEGEIPGASAIECGNYLDMNLNMAKYYAKKYKEVLI